MKTKERVNKMIGYICLLVLGGLFLFPLVWILSNSFKTYENLFAYSPKLFPPPLKFENYIEALTYISLPFWRFILNSVIITAASVVGVVLSSSLIAYAFSRLKWRGRNALFMIVVLTVIIPTEVVITPQFIFYNKLSLLDTWVPLILPWFFGKAFYIFMIRQTMMGIPMEMDESAKMDGCNVSDTMASCICSGSNCSNAYPDSICIFPEIFYSGGCCISGKRIKRSDAVTPDT